MSHWWDEIIHETPTKRGRRMEKDIAKSYGARPHPGSGSGNIKDDASDDTIVYEFKTTDLKSYRLKAQDLLKLQTRAHQQGKEAMFVVYFVSEGVKAEITPRRI